MIQVYPREDEPTYEELEHKCSQLRGSLNEARRSCRYTAEWNRALLALFVISAVLLVLTWGGCITV